MFAADALGIVKSVSNPHRTTETASWTRSHLAPPANGGKAGKPVPGIVRSDIAPVHGYPDWRFNFFQSSHEQAGLLFKLIESSGGSGHGIMAFLAGMAPGAQREKGEPSTSTFTSITTEVTTVAGLLAVHCYLELLHISYMLKLKDLTKPLDPLHYNVSYIFNLFFRIEPSDPEADRSVDEL